MKYTSHVFFVIAMSGSRSLALLHILHPNIQTSHLCLKDLSLSLESRFGFRKESDPLPPVFLALTFRAAIAPFITV